MPIVPTWKPQSWSQRLIVSDEYLLSHSPILPVLVWWGWVRPVDVHWPWHSRRIFDGTGDLLSELWLLSGGHACFLKALLQYQAREANWRCYCGQHKLLLPHPALLYPCSLCNSCLFPFAPWFAGNKEKSRAASILLCSCAEMGLECLLIKVCLLPVSAGVTWLPPWTFGQYWWISFSAFSSLSGLHPDNPL